VVAGGLPGLAAGPLDWLRRRHCKAADVILQHVATTGRDQDMLIYPYLMCWRQYLELQMKSLILLADRYLRESIQMPRTH
jgi:hypothetical protein